MNITVIMLALCQAMLMTTISLVLSSSALVGVQLASPDLATVPLAIQYLATMLFLIPVAKLMEIHGRKRIFISGAILGALGLAISAAGIRFGNFVLFSAAGLLIGAFNAVGQYYRFAAAEAVPVERKSEAISMTLTGGVLAAMAGPVIAQWTREALSPPFFASFLVLIVIALMGALFAFRMQIPPSTVIEIERSRRPFAEISRQPKFRLAVAGAVISYSVMNLLMTATPLAMRCSDLGFDRTATVIQWHLVAMFAPSFFTGRLIQRIGVLRVMLIGCLLNLGGIGVSLTGLELVHFQFGLILLGIGWNFLYVGATSLLTEAHRKEEKGIVQGFNDTAVFLAVTVATLFSGTLVNSQGWQAVNMYAALPIILLSAWIFRHITQRIM